MRPMRIVAIEDALPGRSFRQGMMYLLLASLPLLLFFLMWRVALAHTGIVLQSARSPDGTYVAELIRRDPGGDATYDYYVRLRRTSSSIVDPLLGNEYQVFERGEKAGEIRFEWNSASQLTVSCTGCSGYKVGAASWQGVRFRYILKGPTE